MPIKKKPTQEELFPHNGFPYRLEVIEDDGTKKGTKRISWFECEWHLTKHIERHRLASGDVQTKKGETPLSGDPFKPKPVKKTRAKPKAKATAPKASATKASKTTKAKKPSATSKTTSRTTKNAKKEVFSNLDTFFTK